ncbi:hypothetical protein LIER_07572 [Lithospermum erythrorhizon]|uniref:Uncharacterized protein n=1 Tax=Lithospermum erythrorhizon TaxID=34254 RepID=A0AAV3P9P3_LITER
MALSGEGFGDKTPVTDQQEVEVEARGEGQTYFTIPGAFVFLGGGDNLLIVHLHLASRLNSHLKQKKIKKLSSRFRSTWLELGDANTNYFHSSITINQCRSKLCTIKNAEGTILTEPEDIVKEVVTYFQTMFIVVDNVDADYVELINTRVDEDYKGMLVAQPTKDEVDKAMLSMKVGKSPGLDGLTAEFYQRNCSLIGNDVFFLYL